MSEQLSKKNVLAIVTTKPEHVAGAAPTFIVQSLDEIQQKAFLLENILDAMAHELDQTTYILVRH
jgi:tetrahydromethanopterin S-methyltransferase subunit B